MSDNPSGQEPPQPPPLPISSDAEVTPPTTHPLVHVPPPKRGLGGRVLVMLSSLGRQVPGAAPGPKARGYFSEAKLPPPLPPKTKSKIGAVVPPQIPKVSASAYPSQEKKAVPSSGKIVTPPRVTMVSSTRFTIPPLIKTTPPPASSDAEKWDTPTPPVIVTPPVEAKSAPDPVIVPLVFPVPLPPPVVEPPPEAKAPEPIMPPPATPPPGTEPSPQIKAPEPSIAPVTPPASGLVPAESKAADTSAALPEVVAAAKPATSSSVQPLPDQKKPTIELKPKPSKAKTGKFAKPGPVAPAAADGSSTPPPVASRAVRLARKRLVSSIVFYIFFVFALMAVYVGGIYFTHETRVEGQIIPPPGMTLSNTLLIVTDFRDQTAGIVDDLARARAPQLQEIQENQDHVQRARADVASREERIRLLQEQIQAAKDSIGTLIKQARDNAQQIWDGPGAKLDQSYQARLDELGATIASRAKSLKLNYQPDDTYHSPEVWANAYRLALYQVPPGVDGVKEHQWLEEQMTQWRAFTKSVDDKQKDFREQAAAAQMAPSSQVADLNNRIEDLQHRIEDTQTEEQPIKVELQQAETDLAQAQGSEAGLDDKYYKELYSLPAQNAPNSLPIAVNGRFSWRHLERNDAFAQGEKTRPYWLFAVAIRADGRQYWALHRISIHKDDTLEVLIEPGGFISTKAILRPDLPPDEQKQ